MSGFIVPTGNIIKEYLEERDISQKELSGRIDVSEKQLSKLLNGKARLTEDMALKLEKVMPDVLASYWLNYEARYQEYLAREKEEASLEELDLKEIAKRFRFKDVFPHSDLSLVEQAIAMLKLLGVSSFAQYRKACPTCNMEFMQDGGDPESVVVWLRLCEEEIEKQNYDLTTVNYSPTVLKKMLPTLKAIAFNEDIDSSLSNCRKLLNKSGVYFVVRPAIPGAKVRGVLFTHMGHPVICVSQRYQTHDHVWFTILHEIGHLLLHYSVKRAYIMLEEYESEDGKDCEANTFARDFLVDVVAYENFAHSGVINKASEIRKFASEQGVAPGVIVGFLQHDGYIRYDSALNALKVSTRRR